MIFKKITRKLLSYKSKPLTESEELLIQLESRRLSGNVVYGENCKFDGFKIDYVSLKNGYPNIRIGNNCHLSCRIALQSETSEVIIGDGVSIGPGTLIFCRDKIVFENDIMVSWGCTFIDTNAHSLHSCERTTDVIDFMKGWQYKNWNAVNTVPIHVKDNCWVGFNSIVLKGVVLNEGTIIGAGSVVSKSTDEYSIYGGNPAMFIKKTD